MLVLLPLLIILKPAILMCNQEILLSSPRLLCHGGALMTMKRLCVMDSILPPWFFFFRFPSYTSRHQNNANYFAFIFYDLFFSIFINILSWSYEFYFNYIFCKAPAMLEYDFLICWGHFEFVLSQTYSRWEVFIVHELYDSSGVKSTLQFT